ncbi:Endonuclease/exonuclease/phosphatase [Coniella lustricola]|uniref:Endonuclease/exonuclease/phosphatase n=1 Tax=Coniella lustricola TaxID=2025994 RepID=A0A2T3AMK3_9PEZI|nr:Endonuclease/exonuclease/phosphatase [Coniella lustricola]
MAVVDHNKAPLATGQTGSLPSEINIITLNCWGLKFHISKQRHARLAEIGAQLANTHPPPNIVCLQEIWAHEDYLAVRRHLRALLPHGKFYYAGSFGAGLAILSRWPIEQSTFTPYTLNGRPTAFWRGDWYVGKGIAQALIRLLPPATSHDALSNYDNEHETILQVFNTHTHAPYASDKGDSYCVHRMSQVWQLAKLVRGAAERGHLVVAAGDFNMTPLSPEHRILAAHAPIRDVWRVLHPDSSLGSAYDALELARRSPLDDNGDGDRATAATLPPPPTAETNLLLNGATSNSILNTWRWSSKAQNKLGPGQPLYEPALDAPDPAAKRLDYIFASVAPRRQQRRYAGSDGNDANLDKDLISGWVVRDARVGMTQRHPVLGCSLSDHFSVEATLVFHTTTAATTTRRPRMYQDDLGALIHQHRSRQHDNHDDAEDEDKDGAAGTTITDGTLAAPSISQWPLPPGHHNRNHNSRDCRNNITKLYTNDNDNDNDGDTNSEDLRSPAAGAFLSLQSPTPSTSRQSQGQVQEDDDAHAGNQYAVSDNGHAYNTIRSAANRAHRHPPQYQQPLDFDAQLLSSLFPTTTYQSPSSASGNILLPDNMPFTPAEYDSLLAKVHDYAAREAQQTRWRTRHCILWMWITIACYIAVWFIPTQHDSQHGLSSVQNHAINFVLLLLSSLGLVAGVLDGLMALLFFRGGEKRALKEFIWELRNARALTCGETLYYTGNNTGGTKEF